MQIFQPSYLPFDTEAETVPHFNPVSSDWENSNRNLRAPGLGARFMWIGLLCFGWLLVAEGSVLGQSGGRANSKSPPKGNGSLDSKPTPGKGKPVSTKTDTKSPKTETEQKSATAKEPEKGKDTSRWREGHRVENATVTFQISETERFVLTLNGEKGLTALENLALERIADAMRIDSADNRWVVTGRVTEFRGQNYLWIERATRAAKIAGQ